MALYIGNKKYCAIQKSNINNQDILITQNGNYSVGEGYTGFGVVRVKVPEAILDTLTVDPKITQQILEPLHDGFSTVTVNPVTADIDEDIIAGNIKKGINILGVDGTLEFTTETLTVTPTTTTQIKTPTKDGYSKVTINPVTASIDTNIKAGNILKDVKILGVTGTVIQANETTRNITENGTYDAPAPYTGFSQVVVDVKVTQDPLTITPTTTQQTHTAVDEYHGFSPVIVNPVTSDIDENILATNIREGVTILGVEGSIGFEEKTINPTTTKQILTPTKDGFSKVTVNAVTNAIDKDIKPENILEGVDILGVVGTIGFEEKTVTPTTSQQILTPTKNGFSKVTVKAVTNTIDANIKAANIKSGVSILGVSGKCVELKGQTKTITSNGTYTPDTGYNGLTSIIVDVDTVKNQDKTITKNGTYTPDTGYTGFGKVTVNINTVNNTTLTATPKTTKQTFTPTSPYTGYGTVTVNAVTASIDSNIKAENIKQGIKILGVTGTSVPAKLQTKTITDVGTFTPDEGYTGFSSVTVNMDWVEEALQALNAGDKTTSVELQEKTVTQAGTYTPDNGYDGFSKVIVDLTWVNAEIQRLAQTYTTTTGDSFMNATTTQINSACTHVRDYACYYMTTLTDVNLTNATRIGQYAFANTGLQTITISTTSVCTLDSVNCFESTTPTAIYVPDNLVDTYKTATNWVTYADIINGISTKA